MAISLHKIWRMGLDSALETASNINETVLVTTDSNRLFIDYNDTRFEITDFVKDTEDNILATLTPLSKFYYATDTHNLYYYDSGWVCINEGYTHPSMTAADTTSTASPAHGGTFTVVDSVTRDDSGHVSGVNTKTITLPSDENTDTKMTQTASSSSESFPILATSESSPTSGSASEGVYADSITITPSTGAITATMFDGDLSGNAATATLADKATADASGNTITTTYATLASPALTGTPTAPTAATGTSSTQIATTAFVATAVSTAISDIVQFQVSVVTSLPTTGETGVIYLIADEHEDSSDSYDEYLWIESSSTFEKIGNTDIDLTNYVTLDGSEALTNKTYNGYTLASACAAEYTDRSTATAISSTGTTLLTERAIYYGLPTINNSHAYTSSTAIYAPTSGGTAGYFLRAAGTTSAPAWVTPANTRAYLGLGYGTNDGDTTARTVSITNFALLTGSLVSVKFTYAVEAGSTLNVNSTGAKSIYHMSAAIVDDVILAGSTALFVYNGTYWCLLAVDTDAGGDYIDEDSETLYLSSSSASGNYIDTDAETLYL